MKSYYFVAKEKIIKRINILEVLLSFFIIFGIFFSFFYILLSNYSDLLRAIITSLSLAILIETGIIVSHLIKTRETVYAVYNKKIYIISFQNNSYFFDEEFMNSDKFFKTVNDDLIKDIIDNNGKYIGAQVLTVDKINHFREKKNYFSFNVRGRLSFWKALGNLFTIDKFVLSYKNTFKRFAVTKEYKNYDELKLYISKNLGLHKK